MAEDLFSFLKTLKWPFLIGSILILLVYRNSYVSLLQYEINKLEQKEYKLKQALTELRLKKRNDSSEDIFDAPNATIELPGVE